LEGRHKTNDVRIERKETVVDLRDTKKRMGKLEEREMSKTNDVWQTQLNKIKMGERKTREQPLILIGNWGRRKAGLGASERGRKQRGRQRHQR